VSDRVRERRHQARDAEQEHRAEQQRAAAEAVGQRARHERAAREAEQRGAQHGREIGLGEVPFAQQRRCDEADRGRIEAVEQHDHETHEEHEPLKAAERLLVDEGLDIDHGCAIHR